MSQLTPPFYRPGVKIGLKSVCQIRQNKVLMPYKDESPYHIIRQSIIYKLPSSSVRFKLLKKVNKLKTSFTVETKVEKRFNIVCRKVALISNVKQSCLVPM